MTSLLLDIGNIAYFIAMYPQMRKIYKNRKNLKDISFATMVLYIIGNIAFQIVNITNNAFISIVTNIAMTASNILTMYWLRKGKQKMKSKSIRRLSLIAWALATLGFYLVMTKIDLIVHYELYDYGLIFNINWAMPYWYCLTFSFWALAIMSATSYWLETSNNNKYFILLIFLTILIPYHFGLEDVLWFAWLGKFPAENVVWTWYYLNNIFYPWTTSKHLIYCGLGMTSLVICWIIFIVKKWIEIRKTIL